MPWWLVWVLLAVAALVLLIWIGLRLWRAARALLRELQRATEVLDQLQQRAAELEALAAAEPPIEPEITLTPERRAQVHAVRAQVKAQREARRQARFAKVTARWDKITGE